MPRKLLFQPQIGADLMGFERGLKGVEGGLKGVENTKLTAIAVSFVELELGILSL